MRTRSAVALLFFCFLTLSNNAGWAQAPTTPPSDSSDSAPPRIPRVVVDGTRTPNAISDESVIIQLMLMWATPANPDAQAERRLRNLTSRMQLGRSDMKRLRDELARVHPQITALRAQTQAAGQPVEARDAMVQLRASSLETYGRLVELLSPDGSKKLREHVAYIKTRTTVVGREKR